MSDALDRLFPPDQCDPAFDGMASYTEFATRHFFQEEGLTTIDNDGRETLVRLSSWFIP